MPVVTTRSRPVRSSRAAGQSRRSLIAGLAAAWIVAAAFPVAASALSIDKVSLADCNVSDEFFPRDLAVGADGNLRLLLERWGARAEQREVSVGPASVIGNPLQLLAPSPTQGTFTAGALTDAGAVVSFRSNKRPHPKLRAVIWENGKPVGPARTISDPSHSFRGGYLSAAPNGAAAVSFSQHLGKGVWEQRVAVRPAGAQRFLAAVGASPTDQPDRQRGSGGVISETYWGPNGDGLMLWAPSGSDDDRASVIRRIQRDGTLGPVVTLPVRIDYPTDGYSAIKVGPDGTIVLVGRSTTYGDWVDDGHDGEHQRVDSRAQVVTIPAGSNVPSAPVLLREVSGWNDDVDEILVGADIGPDGHVIVAASGGDRRIEMFEGGVVPGSLRRVISFPSLERAGYGDFLVVHTADGGAAAFWGAETVASMRGPGGAWSAPAYVLPKSGWGYSVLESPRALPDGRVAAIVRRSADEDSLGDGPDDGEFVVRIGR